MGLFRRGKNWWRGRAMRRRMKYVSRIPDAVPAGQILCHNWVEPAKVLGDRGFRAWLDAPSAHYKECPCDWAPGLVHYKARHAPNRTLDDAAVAELDRLLSKED